MDPEQEIQKLEKVRDLPVLSVYLSKESANSPSSSEFLSLFHSLIHQNLNIYEHKKFTPDIKKIENYIKQIYDSRGKRSLVFFSSGKNLWQVFEFEFSLPSLSLVLNTVYLEPIKKAIEKHQKYLVLLVDREKARVFTVYLGKIEEHQDFIDALVPQNVKVKKTDYGRDDKVFRHIEDHLIDHLGLVAKTVVEFAQGKDIHFIMIGGHKELFSKIKRMIPYPYNKMILGTFVTELNIPLNDVFLKSKKIASRINKKLLR